MPDVFEQALCEEESVVTLVSVLTKLFESRDQRKFDSRPKRTESPLPTTLPSPDTVTTTTRHTLNSTPLSHPHYGPKLGKSSGTNHSFSDLESRDNADNSQCCIAFANNKPLNEVSLIQM